jgi:membrane-associated phospholipid phosphatase
MKQRLHDPKIKKAWSRFSLWMRDHQPVIRLVILLFGLVIFLIDIPPTIRITFFRLVQTRIVGSPAIGRSFPSGHTSQAFFMATLIATHFHLSVVIASHLYSLALVVGITRLYIRSHYPRDALAVGVLGSAWGLLGAIVDLYDLKGI